MGNCCEIAIKMCKRRRDNGPARRGASVEEWRLNSGPPAVFHRVGCNTMEGAEDVQGGVVRAGAPGLHGGGYEHPGGRPGVRAASGHGAQDASVLGASGYRRQSPPRRPKLDPYRGVIDRIIEEDRSLPKKQRHTAKRIYDRLRAEHGFDGRYTIVKDYVRERRRRTREMYVPLSHPPGDAQCDFGQAKAVIGGVEQTVHYLVMYLPHSDACFVKAYPAETTEAFCDGHVSAFSFLGGSAAEHRLRQHEAGRGKDPGRRPEEAYPRLL